MKGQRGWAVCRSAQLGFASCLLSALSGCVAEVPTDSISQRVDSFQAPSDVRILPLAPARTKLDWHDHATNELGFRIQRRALGTSHWQNIDRLDVPNLTSYVDIDIQANGCSVYEYRVGAYKENDTFWSASARVDASKRKMWVWPSPGPDGNMADPAVRANLIDHAVSQNVDVIHLSTYQILNLENDTVNLNAFIDLAYANNIGVTFVYGAPDWAFTPVHTFAHDAVQKAVDFIMRENDYASTGLLAPKRVGVVLDVEPWVGGWQGGVWSDVASQYLDLLADLRVLVHGDANENIHDLTFDVTFTFWLDDDTAYPNGACQQAPCLLDWGGETRLLSHHVLRLSDANTLTDYNNTPAGITGRAVGEITYASQPDPECKRVAIGVETQCPEGSTTFCGFTRTSTNDVLNTVHGDFASYVSLGGFAVNRYGSWAEMAP